MATPTTLPATFVAGNVLTAAQMNNLRGAFRVLQVESAGRSSTASMSSSTYADITGLSVTITPQATTNKVLVICQLVGSSPGTTSANFQVLRGATAIGIGDQEGTNRFRASFSIYQMYGQSGIISVLDSPATTSATTYKVQWRSAGAAQTIYLNRANDWADSTDRATMYSSITVMEISA